MKKKYLIAEVVFALSLSMAGCGKDTGNTAAEGTAAGANAEEQAASLLPMESVDETAFTLRVGDYSLNVKKIEGMNYGGSMNQWWNEEKSSGAFMCNGDTIDESTIVYVYHLRDEAYTGETESMANDDGTNILCYASCYFPTHDAWANETPLSQAEIDYEAPDTTAARFSYEKELVGGKYLTVDVYARNTDAFPWEEALPLTDDSYYSEGEVGETSTDTIGHSETEGKSVYYYYESDSDVTAILGQDMEIIAKRPNNSTINHLGNYQLDNYEVYYQTKKLTKDEFEECSDIDGVSDFEIQTIVNGDGDEIVCRKVQTEYGQYVEFYKQLDNENVAILIEVCEVDMNEVNPEDFIDLTKDCYFDFAYSEGYVIDKFKQ